MKWFWWGQPAQKDKNTTINKRVVNRADIDSPKNINSAVGWSYACPTTKSAMLRPQVWLNHTSCIVIYLLKAINYLQIILYEIEGDFQTSTKNKLSSLRATNTLHHCIFTTCWDDNITCGSHKHINNYMFIHWNQTDMCNFQWKNSREATKRQWNCVYPYIT